MMGRKKGMTDGIHMGKQFKELMRGRHGKEKRLYI